MEKKKDGKKEKTIVVIGPVYPYKGGISHYTGLMVRALKERYEVITESYKMQYPRLLFKKEQRDYSNKTFEIEDAEFLIHTANPFNWISSKVRIREKNPDLVIVSWWHPYFSPCYHFLLRGLKKIPVLFICHNVLPHERFVLDRWLTRQTLKRGNLYIVQSKEDEKNLKELFPKRPYRRTVHPTYNAFRLKGMDKKEARESLGIAQDEKILLFFGLVREYKGLEYLITAAPMITRALNGVKIFVVGDFGNHKEEYVKQIQKSGAEEIFEIRDGYVPDEEVEPYFAAADLTVCPYVSATQSGIVQISFGFNVPVIATAVGGLPEAVTDQKTGYVVEPKNPQAIADAVIRYFEEGKEEEFRENVRSESERFSWEHFVDVVEDLWKEADGR